MRFTPLKPPNWPQDVLRVPSGQGGMPRVDPGNAAVVRSEFFAMVADFAFPAAAAAGTFRREIIPTPQDGDVWVDQIAVVSWEEDPAEPMADQQFLGAMVTIRDARTGRSLILNRGIREGFGTNLIPADSVPINLFRTLPQSGTEVGVDYAGDVPVPCGFRSKGTMPEPFCFTRGGAIDVSLTTLAAGPATNTFDVTIGFLGWKEYAHAAR